MQSYINVKLEGYSGSRLGVPMQRKFPMKYTSISEKRRKQFKSWCRRGIAFLCSQVGVGSLVLCYTLVGASLFVAIESPTESRRMVQVSILRNRVIGQLWNVTENYNLIHRKEWVEEVEKTIQHFQSLIVREIRMGYDGSSDPIWTFPAALMYSLSVYTTIGYGNLTPQTDLGKVMTIFYALFGIPLLLLYMANIGDLLATSFRQFYFYLNSCQRNVEKAQKNRQTQLDMDKDFDDDQIYKNHHFWSWMMKRRNARGEIEDIEKLPSVFEKCELEGIDVEEDGPNDLAIPISTCLIVFFLYVSLGSLLFSLWEGWNYLDGSYFCFVTLVTIGFGDLVPGDSEEARQKKEVNGELVLCTIYILFGMALMAMCFHLTQERFFLTARKIGKVLGLT